MQHHHYEVAVQWTGNRGEGTRRYRGYDRRHTIQAQGKPLILGSSDPAFLGDPARYNPEELFLAALAACHMLWYLHLCSEAGIVVTAYQDAARGILEETADGSGRFTSVTLYPQVAVTHAGMADKAMELHQLANSKCFIANSCNFPVHHQAVCTIAGTGTATS